MQPSKTGDGSHTLLSEKYKVPYHSFHGAVEETNHVFIQEGLIWSLKFNNNLRILEVGLGTGLNVLATLEAISTKKISIDFHSVEPFPIQYSTFETLNYKAFLTPETHSIGELIHNDNWGIDQALLPNFNFIKHQIAFEKFSSDDKFDLIYFDAFAPNSQPELWEIEVLQKTYDLLNDRGALVTYCAKGQFKRDLKKVGYRVESPPGPPGKREMTRAVKGY